MSLKDRIVTRLLEQSKVALTSHAVGVQGVVLVVAGYAATHSDQITLLLGPKWGAILLGVAALATTVARVWNSVPEVPSQESKN